MMSPGPGVSSGRISVFQVPATWMRLGRPSGATTSAPTDIRWHMRQCGEPTAPMSGRAGGWPSPTEAGGRRGGGRGLRADGHSLAHAPVWGAHRTDVGEVGAMLLLDVDDRQAGST